MKKVKQRKNGRPLMDGFISVNVDPEMRRELDERAQRDERSVSYVVRKAIEQYLAAPGTKEVAA